LKTPATITHQKAYIKKVTQNADPKYQRLNAARRAVGGMGVQTENGQAIGVSLGR
jgi:hypothetical protein